MKPLAIAFFIILLWTNVKCQNIPNGDFENWTKTQWLNPTGLNSGNIEALRDSVPLTVNQVTDKFSGNYALKVETQKNSTDTLFGWAIWGELNDYGVARGVSYTQKPESLTGYIKYNIDVNDPGLVVVWFLKADTVLAVYTLPISGVQNTFVKFTLPFSLNIAPDSITVGFTSSDAFSSNPKKPGNWLIIDSLTFTGTGITQQLPNADFEQWNDQFIEIPNFWATAIIELANTSIVYVEKTLDKQNGSSAIKLTSSVVPTGDNKPHFLNTIFIGNNYFNSFNETGFSYNKTNDALVLYYKYSPLKIDSARINLSLSKLGNIIYLNDTLLLASSDYKRIEIPFNLAKTPDTMRLFISSSSFNDSSRLGSILYVDNIHLKSSEVNMIPVEKSIKQVSIFPNPVRNFLNIEIANSINNSYIDIYNSNGLLVKKQELISQSSLIKINVEDLPSGTYIFNITKEKSIIIKGKFLKN